MRPIDADALKDHLEDLQSYTILGEEHPYYSGETNALSVAIQNIDNAPTIDAVPVVRCKDCKHYLKLTFYAVCTKHDLVVELNDYCSDGERRVSE